jgi:protein involved in polysaccharide export with SLBB domain
MLPGETLWDLIQLAGGTLTDAEVDRLEVARIGEVGLSQRSTITLEEAKEYEVRNGDGFFVRSTGESQQMILVEGALFGEPAKAPLPRKIPEKPIVVNVPYSRGISFLQVLEDFGGPTPFANAAESYVVRESGERFKIDGEKLWETRDSAHDILLEPGDHVFIPLKKLQVVVAGEVNNGGVFPYQTGMRTADYIAAAGGVDLEFGDPDRIFLVDERGKQTPINMEFEVPPGSVIYVDKRAFEYVHRGLDNTLVIVGFASAVIGLTVAILNLVDYFAE